MRGRFRTENYRAPTPPDDLIFGLSPRMLHIRRPGLGVEWMCSRRIYSSSSRAGRAVEGVGNPQCENHTTNRALCRLSKRTGHARFYIFNEEFLSMGDILMSVLSGVNKRLKDMGDGTVAEVVYNANGSSGGGSALADTLLTDANGVLFAARDNGSAITYARIDTGLAYTPVAPIGVADALANGSDNAGVTQPSGGTGIRGWLSGIYGGLASLVSTTNGKAARVVLVDPTTGNGSLVQAFHNADNQTLGGTSYGLMTGGVDQLLNGTGTLDRKRGVSTDGVAATGLAAEVPMLWNGTSYDRAPGSALAGMKVSVGNFPATQPVSGTLAISSLPALPAGSNVIGSVSVSNFPATQPISAVALPLPTGAALDTTLSSLSSKFPNLGPQTIANSSAVNIASDQIVAVNAAGVLTSGSIAALNATVALMLNGASGAMIDLRGTFVATLAFQGTVDGLNWVSLAAIPVGSATNSAPVSTTTAVGAWHVLCAGMQQIRAVATTFTSGTITATIRATNATPFLYNAPTGVTNAVTVSGMAAGANLIGDMGVEYRGNATGAASVAAVMSPAVPSAASVKPSAGRLLGVMLQNSATTLRSAKFWNVLNTGVTLGTTPALFELDIPAGSNVYMAFEGGIGFSTAITYAVTSAKGLSDNTATGLAINDVSGSLIYA